MEAIYSLKGYRWVCDCGYAENTNKDEYCRACKARISCDVAGGHHYGSSDLFCNRGTCKVNHHLHPKVLMWYGGGMHAEVYAGAIGVNYKDPPHRFNADRLQWEIQKDGIRQDGVLYNLVMSDGTIDHLTTLRLIP